MGMSKQLIDHHGESFEPAYGDPVETGTRSSASGMSLDDTIHEFMEVSARANELYNRKRELVSVLAATAWENRGEQKTVHLSASDGSRLKVEFKTERTYDPAQMFTAADLLGKETFDELFSTKIEFQAKLRNLKAFMNTHFADEKIETAKQIIRDATTEVEKTPYVSTEKAA